MSQPLGRRPFVIWGVRFGAVVGLLGLVPAVLTFAGASLDAINATTTAVVVLGLVAFFAAGLVAARATGEVSAGSLAGLVAGALFAGLSGLGNLALAIFDGPSYGALLFAGQPPVGEAQLVVLTILRTLTVMLLYAALGAGLGGLGALAARALPR